MLQREMDAVLADSFPASDPPSWTPAIAETRPAGPAAVERPSATFPTQPAWLRRLGSLLGAAALVLMFPFFVVGLPVALFWRFVLEVPQWRAIR